MTGKIAALSSIIAIATVIAASAASQRNIAECLETEGTAGIEKCTPLVPELEDSGDVKDLEKVLRRLGFLLYFEKRYKEATDYYTTAVGLGLNNSYLFYDRGTAYTKLKEFGLAVRDYERSIELNSEFAPAHLKLGYVHARLSNWQEAIANLDKGIALNPNVATAYNNRAWAYLQLGQPSSGLADAIRALELTPNDPVILDTRGRIYEAIGLIDEAIKDFERALELGLDAPETREALARVKQKRQSDN